MARRGLSAADVCSAIAGCALVAISLSNLWTDLTYDEAVYLRLARTIAETGLPLRRVYEDFSQFRLFENSPPLVLYVAAISQQVFPGHDLLPRLVHLAAFVLPTYLLVWWVARSRFGAPAALASLVALLTNVSYLRATPHVLLNVPLGLLACMGLVAFDAGLRSPVRRRSYLLVAALSMFLAVWTKYQAVCIAVALLTYLTYTLATRGFAAINPMLLPLAAIVIGGATAVMTLFWFFWTFGGSETLAATLTLNAGRMSPAAMPMREIVRAAMDTARECEHSLGGVLLLLCAFTICVEQRHRRLVVLLASYVAVTIAFNVILFRLPGAGTSYLHSAVPAVALLAGPAAARLVALAMTTAARTLLALAGSSSRPDELPRPNGSRIAAAYIAAHSPPSAGVLAETVAIEFYSGHPVRALGNTYPREFVLRSLEGTSGDDISFVVVDATAGPKNLDELRQQWNALLAEHFELVSTGAPGVHVYRRLTP
jgi:hypothetical protein